jgi:hypothetical protein
MNIQNIVGDNNNPVMAVGENITVNNQTGFSADELQKLSTLEKELEHMQLEVLKNRSKITDVNGQLVVISELLLAAQSRNKSSLMEKAKLISNGVQKLAYDVGCNLIAGGIANLF